MRDSRRLDAMARSRRVRVVASLVALTVTACGGEASSLVTSPPTTDSNVAATTATTPRPTTTEPVSTESVVASPTPGGLDPDPAGAFLFTDPANQITNDRLLVQYVLPGLIGDGADCLEQQLDHEQLLDEPIVTAAEITSTTVIECVVPSDLGNVVSAFATTLQDRGVSNDPQTWACVASDFEGLERDVQAELLESIYVARLDLAARPTSPGIAADIIVTTTDCVEAPAATTTTSTTSSTTTSTTTTTIDPLRPAGVPWVDLRPGDCVVDLPERNIQDVEVVDCSAPHIFEVVGWSPVSLTFDPEEFCLEELQTYAGDALGQLDLVYDWLRAEKGEFEGTIVCIAYPGDESTRRESIATP